MTILQKTVVVASLALVAVTGIYETCQVIGRHKQNQILDKILTLSKTEHQSFMTESAGLNDSERGDLARQTFAPMRTAFDAMTKDASAGNKFARDALFRTLQIPELGGMAVYSLGVLAGNGDDQALEVLLHPQKRGTLLSGSVGALKAAADNGNQQAIDFLAAVAKNPDDQPLWFMAAHGLNKAAASGNPMAVDALINLLASKNRSVLNAAESGLKMSAANQNTKAAEALRSTGNP